jgi:hypothetical protein
MKAIAVILSLFIAGCATNAIVTDEISTGELKPYSVDIDYGPNSLDQSWKDIFENALNQRLEAAGLLGRENADNNAALVTFTEFRMRSTGTRMVAGILAGTDSIVSPVKVTDPKTGAVLGEAQIETKNISAWGTTEGFIKDHANKVADYLVRSESAK